MVKVNSVRQGKEIGVGRAFEFASESTPGLVHIVVCTKDQTVCSCTGFQMHGHCWHLRWVFENHA